MSATQSIISKQDEKMITDLLGQNKKKRIHVRKAPIHNRMNWEQIGIGIPKETLQVIDEQIRKKPWLSRAQWALETITEKVESIKSQQK